MDATLSAPPPVTASATDVPRILPSTASWPFEAEVRVAQEQHTDGGSGYAVVCESAILRVDPLTLTLLPNLPLSSTAIAQLAQQPTTAVAQPTSTAQASTRMQGERGTTQPACVSETSQPQANGSPLASTARNCAALLHCSLRSVKLGLSDEKLMVVPNDRGTCWLCEFVRARSASAECVAALRSLGSASHLDVTIVGTNAPRAGV